MEVLLTVMERLRDKKTGCEWDKEQDFKSIAPFTIEEAYEVADAIARENHEDLKLELGDLLLQVVFLSQIAKEEGLFEFNDVANAISHKLISRHPYVFEDPKEHKGCLCGEILKGKVTPKDCPLFRNGCTPEDPVGACMVSSEGTCAAEYKYGV